jgi:hypothetical protein
VSKQRTHARAHALVGWLSGRLDLSVRPCRRARGVAGVGVVYQHDVFLLVYHCHVSCSEPPMSGGWILLV